MQTDRHIIFGTAGHVDHGKSALVLALTGTDPDRLAEEKAREMTIDLGFAFLDLPGFPEPVAIVDVPGHEMFVRNMVAGATGIDAAIFVVAADEGVMPQTLEHLDVLHSLGIAQGLVALTKSDKAAPERIEQVADQVRRTLAGTALREAQIVPVSALTGAGLPELRQALADLAAAAKARTSEGVFRLPIDRVFTIKGAGTVVTGTVVSGSLRVGEKVARLPQERSLRVRYLQVHNLPADQVFAGQRAAVNLADIEKEEIARGDVLVTPGAMSPTLMLDARLDISQRAPSPLAQRTRLRLHHGTREVMARVVLLEADHLEPGASSLAQLRLEQPLVAAVADRFVLRSYSPMQVVGGGSVVDPHPRKRRKAAGAADLAAREQEPVPEMVARMLDEAGARGLVAGHLQRTCGLAASELAAVLQQLQDAGRAVPGRRDYWFGTDATGELAERAAQALAELHSRYPLRSSIPLPQLVGAVALPPDQREGLRLALQSLSAGGTIVSEGDSLRLAAHGPRWSPRDAASRERLLSGLLDAGLSAPSAAELAGTAGLSAAECQRMIEALIEAQHVEALSPGLYLHPQVLASARRRVLDYLAQHPKMTIADARSLLGVSRKYLLPFLERLDRERVTIRHGDYRTAAPKRADA
jgi:selenocysteine-specific elongation factor